MNKGSQDMRDVIAIHPLVIVVILLGALDLGLSSLIAPAMPGSGFLAQAAGSVNTKALDTQCTGAYDYTCQYPAMGQEGKQCGAGRQVQSSQVKGYCVLFNKAHAEQVLGSNGQWMSPEEAANLPPNIGSQVSGGFVTPDSTNLAPASDQMLTTGTTQGAQDALPSTPVAPVNSPVSYPNGAQFMPSETSAVPDTFGAQTQPLETNTSVFSTGASNPTTLTNATYNVTNASGVCNGCFDPGSASPYAPVDPAFTTGSTNAAGATDYSNYADFRPSDNIEDDRNPGFTQSVETWFQSTWTNVRNAL